MNKLRSFTLVEMIIVIVLIGIMLSITLNISGNQTKELRFRIARENFLSNYNSFIIRAITTNRSDLKLSFIQGTGVMSGNDNTLYFEPINDVRINNIIVGSTSQPGEGIITAQELTFDSDTGGCVLNAGVGEIRIGDVEIILKYMKGDIDPKSYIINLTTCKMRRGT